jgi:hypothetical protein
MPKRKYTIKLTDKERKFLMKTIKSGTSSARIILRANVLLLSDSSAQNPMTVTKLAELLQTTPTTIQTIRTEYCESGLDVALFRKKRQTPPVAPKVDGNVEAHIIALCCGEPPEGYSRWTVRLIADKCVELGYVDSISHMTVSRTLKKTNLSLT